MQTGPAKSVQVIQAADLKENGGTYELRQGPAIPVAVVSDAGGIAGPSLIIYEVADAGGITGPALKIKNDTGSGRQRTAGPAIKVRVVSGSL